MKTAVRLVLCMVWSVFFLSFTAYGGEVRNPVFQQGAQKIINQLMLNQGSLEYEEAGVSFGTKEEASNFIRYFYRYEYWGNEKVSLAVMSRSDIPSEYRIGILTADSSRAASQHKNVQQTLEGAAAQIRSTTQDPWQQAELAYQWVYDGLQYDYELKNLDLYSSLSTGKSVCYGYASSFRILCDLLGLENEMVYGKNHVWNRVKLDGEWRYLDITWNKNLGEHRWKFLTWEEWQVVYPNQEVM